MARCITCVCPFRRKAFRDACGVGVSGPEFSEEEYVNEVRSIRQRNRRLRAGKMPAPCVGFANADERSINLIESNMAIPLHIKFLNIPASEAIEAEIRKRAEKLQQFSDRIIRCDVTIETEGKHQQQGHLYQVRVDLTVPGTEIALNRIQPNEDVYVAVHDAFDAAVRKLQEHLQIKRGDVKSH